MSSRPSPGRPLRLAVWSFLGRQPGLWRDDLRQRGYAFVVVRNLQQLQAYVRLHHGQGVSAELMASVTEAVQLD